jgi:hypothetical protein
MLKSPWEERIEKSATFEVKIVATIITCKR